MKERPILMSAPMIRATLDGTKTQTRRIVKGRWLPTVQEVMQINGKWVWSTVCYDLTTPYGQPGDRLWVRETFRRNTNMAGARITYRADNSELQIDEKDLPVKNGQDVGICDDHVWKPSIFMPRWASRIALEVTGVRVQRLQEISEDDAKSEGVAASREIPEKEILTNGGNVVGYRRPVPAISAKERYSILWESINGPGSWAINPWVWSITFKRISP